MGTPHSGFQERATSRTGPQLYPWGARALFIGEAFGLSAHRNAVAVLALGLDEAFGVANDAADPSTGYRRCRSAVIPPNTLHQLVDTCGAMAFLYVDAMSHDLVQLRTLAGSHGPRADFDVSAEGTLIAMFRDLRAGRRSWHDVKRELAALLDAGHNQPTDPRVQAALDILHADVAARVSLDDLAARVGLSGSRFRRLFVAATGVSLKRYRVWIAMGAAVRAIARSDSLTAAALDAGFSSSAHFSAAYREMFGMEPSRLARTRLTLHSGG
jgi:AraC-like DNA-binding protein